MNVVFYFTEELLHEIISCLVNKNKYFLNKFPLFSEIKALVTIMKENEDGYTLSGIYQNKKLKLNAMSYDKYKIYIETLSEFKLLNIKKN